MAFPSLPPISNSDALSVFTHPGYIITQKGLRKDEEVVQNYERLAFLGDSKLKDVITQYLYEHYPTFRVGAYAAQRSELEAKIRLAKWADAYGFMAKLKCHEANGLAIRDSVEVRAKVFQAYVGAAHLNEGEEAVKIWIGELIKPLINIEEEVVEVFEEVGEDTGQFGFTRDIKSRKYPRPPSKASKGYLAKLNEDLQKRGCEGLKWIEKSDGPAHSKTWTMTAIHKGKEIAKGAGCKKQIAKESAARMVLEAISVGDVGSNQLSTATDGRSLENVASRIQAPMNG